MLITALLLAAELVYFRIADKCNIIDKPNQRSSASITSGSFGVAYILLFLIGSLILATGDVTYLILLLVYGVDGCLTICHRILLHENLGEAHRKHAYQLMANELRIGHLKVASFYALLQLAVSLGFIYLCPALASATGLSLVGSTSLLLW